LNESLSTYYSNHTDQLSQLGTVVEALLWAKKNGFPSLGAKAAPTRHAVEHCLILAQLHAHGRPGKPPFRFAEGHRLAGHSERHCQLVVELFGALHEFFQACKAAPFDEARCRQGMYAYLQSHDALHKLWRIGLSEEEAKHQPWHWRPKGHILQHMAEEKVDMYGTPMNFWGYRDEDFVGRVKKIARMTIHPATMEARMMQKLRIVVALQQSAAP
jgi:hypothetical protein